MYEYKATLTRVVDGDTLDLAVSLGFNVCLNERFRLYGINAPEVKGVEREAGLRATEWLNATIAGKELAIQTIKDGKEKYGRWLAIIFAGGANVNEAMVAAGHAVFKDYG